MAPHCILLDSFGSFCRWELHPAATTMRALASNVPADLICGRGGGLCRLLEKSCGAI
jgi:hypothetical protein